jgi:hypothetical protein
VSARFSAPVQSVPGSHPASCTMGTRSFPRVKSGRRVTLTLTPFLCRGRERVELYLCSPYGPYSLYRASVPVKECALPLSYTKKYALCFRHAIDLKQLCSNVVGFMNDEVLFNNPVKVTRPHKEVHCKQYRRGNGVVSGTSNSYCRTQFEWYSLQFYLLIICILC